MENAAREKDGLAGVDGMALVSNADPTAAPDHGEPKVVGDCTIVCGSGGGKI
jgi:hypothetical protein